MVAIASPPAAAPPLCAPVETGAHNLYLICYLVVHRFSVVLSSILLWRSTGAVVKKLLFLNVLQTFNLCVCVCERERICCMMGPWI